MGCSHSSPVEDSREGSSRQSAGQQSAAAVAGPAAAAAALASLDPSLGDGKASVSAATGKKPEEQPPMEQQALSASPAPAGSDAPAASGRATPSSAGDGASGAGGGAALAPSGSLQAAASGGSNTAAQAAAKKKAAEEAAARKARRAAAGSEAVRDQIRRLVVGGPQSEGEKARVIDVSDSEEDDEAALAAAGGAAAAAAAAAGGAPRRAHPPEVVEAICSSLRGNFVFKGIPEDLLHEMVLRMERVDFDAGATILQQGAAPSADDRLYVLSEGTAEVVIFGAVDASRPGARSDEQLRVEGHAVRITQGPGWVFGDVALLFNSPRTASVVASTAVVLYSMDKTTFLRFVMRHAQGARALRFVRKVPLLKGLSDNDLLRVAERMPERVYGDGAALIRYGERGDEMYLIRYGKVRVLVPDTSQPDSRREVALLGRGQFVGERSVINDRLRSADCVAQGRVQVIVLRKRDFLDLDNPLLAWMLDYDAVSAVLKSLPAFKGLGQDAMEHVLDRFDARQELHRGEIIIKQGDLLEKLYVMKIGDVVLMRDGLPLPANSPEAAGFIKQAGGFAFFGDACLDAITRSPYTVCVASELAHVLALHRRQLDSFLGTAAAGLASRGAVVAALLRCKSLSVLREEQLDALIEAAEPIRYGPGETVTPAGPGPCAAFFLVRSGEVLLLPPPAAAAVAAAGAAGAAAAVAAAAEDSAVGRLTAGELHNEGVLTSPAVPLTNALVAGPGGAVVITFELASLNKALAGPGGALRAGQRPAATTAVPASATAATAPASAAAAAAAPTAIPGVGRAAPAIDFRDLELRRVVGTGQFGLVRVVRHVKSNEVFALKVMHKAPLVESKQIEHVINERRILGECCHPFTVALVGAYQDARCLYLLQEWVPGGELFHHLDIEGSFGDDAACFYAANVLLALEFLHGRGIVYRDLKPENLLLDPLGYIKVADFGFAKKIGADRTFTICGTPDYQAPEVIMRRGTGVAADYWALGVLIFEMLVGDPPFKSLTGDPWDTFRRTLSGRFYVPHFIGDAAADLIFKLLQVNPEKRLGAGPGGVQEIKSHRWFSRIDWGALEGRRLPAPIRPALSSPLDTSNFDNFDDAEDDVPPPPPAPRPGEKAQTWDLWEWMDSAPWQHPPGSAAAAAVAAHRAAVWTAQQQQLPGATGQPVAVLAQQQAAAAAAAAQQQVAAAAAAQQQQLQQQLALSPS